jgi:hypothetical protein
MAERNCSMSGKKWIYPVLAFAFMTAVVFTYWKWLGLV